MEFFGRETKIDFMGCRRWAGMISIILCTVSIIILIVKGLNWGLEFTGGTEAQLHFSHQAAEYYNSVDIIQAYVAPQTGPKIANIQTNNFSYSGPYITLTLHA